MHQVNDEKKKETVLKILSETCEKKEMGFPWRIDNETVGQDVMLNVSALQLKRKNKKQ